MRRGLGERMGGRGREDWEGRKGREEEEQKEKESIV